MSFCNNPRNKHFCEGYSCYHCPACLARMETATDPLPAKAIEIMRENDLCNKIKKTRLRLCPCGFSTGNPDLWGSHQKKIHDLGKTS